MVGIHLHHSKKCL